VKPRAIDIEVLDAVTSRMDAAYEKKIQACLSYKSVYWRQGQYRKEKKEYLKKAYKTKGKNLFFGTGLLPRVRAFLTYQKLAYRINEPDPIRVNGKIEKAKKIKSRDGKIITLREDQMEAVSIAVRTERGVLKSATGTGKSYLMLGILCCIDPTENVLILCHNTSIIQQLYDEFKTFFKSIQMFGGDVDPLEKFKPFKKQIILSTIQSFVLLDPKNYCDYFSAVFIDEMHRISSLDGTYGKVLSNILAPMRLGFTATPPTTMEAIFAYESLLGPIIFEFGINKAAEKDVLAKPRVKLIKAQYPPDLRDMRDYHTVYYHGIVNNKSRNRQAIEIIRDCVARDESILVFVNKIEHGNNLLEIADEVGLELGFVQGSSTTEVRERVKHELKTGGMKAVVATSVWKEGINIPSLNNILNAGGGKSEIQTLQNVGRGLRITEDKKTIVIYDFFDSGHHYLIEHAGQRICIYMSNDWM